LEIRFFNLKTGFIKSSLSHVNEISGLEKRSNGQQEAKYDQGNTGNCANYGQADDHADDH